MTERDGDLQGTVPAPGGVVHPETQQLISDHRGRPVRAPEELEAEAEWIRARLAPAPEQGQVKTPDAIIDDLEFAKHAAARSAVIIRDADKTKRAITRVHAIAYGKALKASSGKSAELRDADAQAATEGLKVMLDAAEVAYDFARAVAKSVEGSTSAVQTQSKMIAITFGLAGTGRES